MCWQVHYIARLCGREEGEAEEGGGTVRRGSGDVKERARGGVMVAG